MDNSLLVRRIELKNQFKSSANWFYWIAALSIVNTIVLISGGNYNFIFGLGISQVIDALSISETGDYSIYGIILNTVVAGFFILFGLLAHKKQKSFYIIGMIFYALDGVIYILGEDLLGVGFHLWALFSMWGGYKVIDTIYELDNQIEKIEKEENPAVEIDA